MYRTPLTQWIKQDVDRWNAVCGANGRSMTQEEAYQTMIDILSLGKPSPEFMTVLYVLMTRYQVSAPASIPT